MLKVLEERNFPIQELRLLASERSVGKAIPFKGKEYKVQLADYGAFQNLDFVLGAASNSIAKKFADDIVSSGAVFIDNSSAFRMDESARGPHAGRTPLKAANRSLRRAHQRRGYTAHRPGK